MAAKVKKGIKKLNKQRHPSKAKRKNAAGASPPPITNAPPAATPNSGTGGTPTPTSTKDDDALSQVDNLISELREHVVQGRIFDARSVVHKLQSLEDQNQNPDTVTTTTSILSRKLEPVRHDMDEVLSQSTHVEALLHELHDDDNWTLAKQKSGVTVHYRREEDSPIHTVRAVTTFDNFSPKDFVRLCSLFVETELTHLWFPGGVMKPSQLLSWHSKYSKVVQLNIRLGLPMISARDTVVLGNGYHMPDRNAFLISTKTLEENTCRYCDIPQPAKGVVRFATESIFYVEMLQSDSISFKMIGRDDLKLKYMPSALLNYLSQGHLPFDMMRTIHKTIRNFEGTEWEKKIGERGEFYSEIEEKVYDQLSKWEESKKKESAGGGGERNGNNTDGNDVQWMDEQGRNDKRNNERATTGKQLAKAHRHYGEIVKQREVFVTSGYDGHEGSSRRSVSSVMIAVLSGLFLSALYYSMVNYPEALPAIALTSLPELWELLRTDHSVLLIIMSMVLFLPAIPVILFFVSQRKRQGMSKAISDKEQSHTEKEGRMDAPAIGNSFDEFLQYINSETSEKAHNSYDEDLPASPTDVSNEEEDDLLQSMSSSSPKKTEETVGTDDGKDSKLPKVRFADEISEMTPSPQPSPTASASPLAVATPPLKQMTTTRRSPPNHQKTKSKSMRSSLNTGLKSMKKAVSLHSIQGKKKTL